MQKLVIVTTFICFSLATAGVDHLPSGHGNHSQSAGGHHLRSGHGNHSQSTGGHHLRSGHGNHSQSGVGHHLRSRRSAQLPSGGGQHVPSGHGNHSQSAGGHHLRSGHGNHTQSAEGHHLRSRRSDRKRSDRDHPFPSAHGDHFSSGGDTNKWGSKLCGNNSLAQAFLSKSQAVFAQLNSNGSFAQFLQQKAQEVAYIQNSANVALLSSNCTQYFNGLAAAQNADMQKERQQRVYENISASLLQQIIPAIFGYGSQHH
ncbi:unnamed protein product [Rotaria socialis]|uniref:Uncharacterized protein n=1 Tax=Rotaria socialis TaxID=392032 RepID=A0A820TQV2_9BILA|nr:unnamed protein product [Rotaria socialis]CAF4475029.1 unnamed protein product [Rotaria socialis]